MTAEVPRDGIARRARRLGVTAARLPGKAALGADGLLATALIRLGRGRGVRVGARNTASELAAAARLGPDAELVWATLPHLLGALASTDPKEFNALLGRAGLTNVGHGVGSLDIAMNAVVDRNSSLYDVALHYLRHNDPVSRPPSPNEHRSLQELEDSARSELPWHTDEVHRRLAMLAQSRPGRGGMPPIVPLIGPRGAGKTDAARWLTGAWHRARVVDAATPWQIGVAQLLGYGRAHETITQWPRRVLLAEGRTFDHRRQYVQPADLDALVRELERPTAPILVLLLRSTQALRSFTQLHDDLLELTGPPVHLALPDLESLTAEAMLGSRFDDGVEAWRAAVQELRQRPGWSGLNTVRRLRTATAQAERDDTGGLATAMQLLAPQESDAPLDELLRELDALEGLDELKAFVHALLDAIGDDKERHRNGLRPLTSLPHLAFLGPPGTGKTTAARLLARILHAAGALPRAEIIEVGREHLVGEYVGQTAAQTGHWVEQATGSMLFVDEAYALDGGAAADFGREAIAALVTAMENRRGRFMTVFAGYDAPTRQMIELNEGLRSRISGIFTFPPLNLHQQVRVFLGLAEEEGLAVEPDVYAAVYRALAADTSGGNARAARSLYERAKLSRAARRAFMGPEPSGLAASDITPP